jgi:transcriptional antiterminator RfaH
MKEQGTCVPKWYVIHTHPKQEGRSDSNLRAWGLETFCPLIKNLRVNQFRPNSYVKKPLFPRYIFAHFDASALLHKVCFTRGVHSVVSFGSAPASVDDEIIDLIKLQIGPDGLVRLEEHFEPGDKVQIKDGLLRNLTGIFIRELNDNERVTILLDNIKYQSRVMVEKDLVRKLVH